VEVFSMIGKITLHYRIIEKLGQGGMGEVYRAEDTNLDRQAALKLLFGVFSTDGHALE
jgi:serine/threonine protein kinase